MDPINQTIPAAFGSGPAFAIALQPVNDGNEHAAETFIPPDSWRSRKMNSLVAAFPNLPFTIETTHRKPIRSSAMKQARHFKKLQHFKTWHPDTAESALAAERESEPADTLTRNQRFVSWVCCRIAAGIMIETRFLKFTGAAESKCIFSKMGLAPRMRWAGGILTAGAILAAILSHMTWLGSSIQGDHGLLFIIALTTFAGGFTVLILHREAIPTYTRTTTW
jgi:hypothetical protein